MKDNFSCSVQGEDCLFQKTNSFVIACVAVARKGKGEGKSGARATRGEKEAPAASPLLISPFSFAGE